MLILLNTISTALPPHSLMHWYPCLPKPHKNSLQNAQNVGCLKNLATNLCPFVSCVLWCFTAPRLFEMFLARDLDTINGTCC